MDPRQMVTILVLAVTVHTALAARVGFVTVATENGDVTGKRKTYNYNIRDGINTVDSFLGVPYAASPVGELRFKNPVELLSSPRRVYATKLGPSCSQYPDGFLDVDIEDAKDKNEVYGEDCLRLNIYTPYKASDKSSYPVMVYFHGGSGYKGSGNWLDGHVLAQNGVVVVMVNYRIGLFGMLTDGKKNSEFPGDYGMYDQVAALKWVNRNIKNFRGDPSKVTIFGNDIGAVSVQLHLMMTETKGLFQRAILQSGVLEKIWTYYEDSSQLKDLFDAFVALMECTAGNTTCIRKASADDIIYGGFVYDMRPTIYEGSRVLTDNPKTQIRSADLSNLSVMIGNTADEKARYFCNRVISHTMAKEANWRDVKWEDVTWKDIKDSKPSFLSEDGAFTGDLDEILKGMMADLTDETLPADFVDRIKREYFPADVRADPKKVTANLIQIRSDMYTVVPSIRFAKLLNSQGVKPYYYVYDNPLSFYTDTKTKAQPSYDYQYNVRMRRYCQFLSEYSYADVELPILFGLPLSKGFSRWVWHRNNYSEDDKKLSLRMMKLWTDFAKHGNPTPPGSDVQWNPFDSKTSDYLSIKADGMKMERNLKADKVKFWEELLPQKFD